MVCCSRVAEQTYFILSECIAAGAEVDDGDGAVDRNGSVSVFYVNGLSVTIIVFALSCDSFQF